MAGAKLIVMYPAPRDMQAFERAYSDEHIPMAARIFQAAGASKAVLTKITGYVMVQTASIKPDFAFSTLGTRPDRRVDRMPLTDDRSKTSRPGPTLGCANPHGDSTVVGLPSLVCRARLPGGFGE